MRSREKRFLTYEQAQNWAIQQGITSKRELVTYVKKHGRPEGFPGRPDTFYNEWISWGDFLQTHRVSSRNYTSYEDCKQFARGLHMKSKIDWGKFVKSGLKPNNIPSEPRLAYINKGWVSWSDFLGYRRGASYGETIIARILNDSKIQHRNQVSFSDCRDKTPLRFDFGILQSGSVVALIEFHGQQHYLPVVHWGGEEYLHDTQRRDSIKLNYCAINQIPLLIIKYEEIQNARVIISNFFSKFVSGLIIHDVTNHNLNTRAYEPWMAYDECRNLSRTLGLKSAKEWRKWLDNNDHLNIPRYPDSTYASTGWSNWFDFLGKLRRTLPDISEESRATTG